MQRTTLDNGRLIDIAVVTSRQVRVSKRDTMSDSLFVAVNFEFQPRPIVDQDLTPTFPFAVLSSQALFSFSSLDDHFLSNPLQKYPPLKKQLDDVALS